MSKKAAKNQPEKKVLEIVDQQKDPMLRSLQKKVRNINKKLTQISELQTKKDLKPEQEEKVSKKNQILAQRQKYFEMIEVYKQVAAQNQKIIRKIQLAELQDLASTLAVKEYTADLGAHFNQSIDNLVKILASSSSNELTLQDRIKQISAALHDHAKNSKLKKSVKQYITANNNRRKANFEALSNQPEPISPQSEQQREVQLKQMQQQEKLQASQKAVEPLTPHVPNTPHVQQTVPESTSVQTQSVQKPQPIPAIVQAVQSNENLQSNAPVEQQPADQNQVTAEVPAQKKQRKYNREYKGYKGGRGGKEGGKNYQDRKYNKPSFKPKYEQKQAEERKRGVSSSSSSSSQEPKARQFKREEVRQLIEDGFIVVGKPKLKARDQKSYYEHEHGNKHHRHHTKKNY